LPDTNLTALLDLPLEKLTGLEMDSALYQHHTGQLHIMFGPQNAREAHAIESKRAEAIIKGLSTTAEFVVLDLPNQHQPSEATRAAARLCHYVVVLTEGEQASVTSGRITVSQLDCWGVASNVVVGVVVNRTVPTVHMKLAEIESGISCPIVGVVPSAGGTCQHSVIHGEPLVEFQSDNDASLSLVHIADQISAGKWTGNIF
jgi:MinD-like ATPase involved in chromosome partitioning or flagellar assembly